MCADSDASSIGEGDCSNRAAMAGNKSAKTGTGTSDATSSSSGSASGCSERSASSKSEISVGSESLYDNYKVSPYLGSIDSKVEGA